MTDDQSLRAFYRHAHLLAQQHGVELDDDQLKDLLDASWRAGFTADATETASSAAAGSNSRSSS